jgi:WD40 repeat protein
MRFNYLTIIISLIISSQTLLGQKKPIASVKLRKPVDHAFVDRAGDLYIQENSGEFLKYDTNGVRIATFKPDDSIIVFEPRDGARLFTWSRSGNWFSYAYFGSVKKQKLGEEFAIDPWLVVSSGDANIWILDSSDRSLKRVNTLENRVEVEVILPDSLNTPESDFTWMREYQGFLFLINQQTGIHVFNTLGKQVKSFPGKNIPYFNFLGQELYYPIEDKIKFYDLFDGTTRLESKDPKTKIELMTDSRIYKIFPDRLEVFDYHP